MPGFDMMPETERKGDKALWLFIVVAGICGVISTIYVFINHGL